MSVVSNLTVLGEGVGASDLWRFFDGVDREIGDLFGAETSSEKRFLVASLKQLFYGVGTSRNLLEYRSFWGKPDRPVMPPDLGKLAGEVVREALAVWGKDWTGDVDNDRQKSFVKGALVAVNLLTAQLAPATAGTPPFVTLTNV